MFKRALVILFSLFFCSALLAAQDSAAEISEGGAEQTAEERSGETPEESSEVVSEDASEKSGRKKISGIIKDFKEKKEAQEDSRPVQAAQFVGDFLTDKFPLTLDFGAEPGENGSMIFATLEYEWGEHFSSRVRFEYTSLNTIDNNPLGYSQTKSKEYGGMLLPCIWYFGDDDVDSMEALWSLGLGVSYSYSNETTESFAALESFYTRNESKSKRHIVSPVLTASVKKPLGKYFAFGSEMMALPFFFIHLNWSAVARPNFMAPVSYDEVYDIFSEPGIRQSVWFDILRYVRVKTVFGYSRMALGRQRAVSDDGRVIEGDYVQHAIMWRYGLELVLPSSNRTRKKNSHLWAGVYYQHDWKLTEFADDYSSDYKGRWILCFGK